ncbi:MAG: type II toxin-antitoxin system VapC family toxin [Elusimicrobia bacterium]|nr:type II toxin-antitoxin system VapC family toxin [Elusimicrobiota bacterium]
MAKVIDAHALLSYLNKESGWEKVENILTDTAAKDKKLLMSVINWGEVYYIILREKGTEETEDIMRIIDTFPIEVIDIDRLIAKQAAIYKSRKRMSYADCFSAALAKLKKAELITGDKEFKSVEDEIKILWIT